MNNKNKAKKFTFIDLFAGIGGFHQAMAAIGGKCVFASEIDSLCRKQYEKQFKIKTHGDVNNCINIIPKFDVLCAGFPCQTFSKAGKQEGFNDDTRGKLFFRIIDILKIHKECKFIILENVRNLADQKDFWNVIQNELKSLNYFITQEPIVLSPSEFGVPQSRERVYILGIKKSLANKLQKTKKNIDFTDLKLEEYKKTCKLGDAFKILNYDSKDNEHYKITKQQENVIKAWEQFKSKIIPHQQIGAPIWLKYFGIGISDEKKFKNKCSYYYEPVKAWAYGHKNVDLKQKKGDSNFIYQKTPKWKQRFIDKNRDLYKKNKIAIDKWYKKYSRFLDKQVYKKFEWNCGPKYIPFKECIIQFRQSGLRIKKSNAFPALVATVNTPIVWDKKNNFFRRITINEAAKLQSFNKSYKFIYKNNLSYKQLGNSVNVKLIKLISKQLFNIVEYNK